MKCKYCGTEDVSKFKVKPNSKYRNRERTCLDCKKQAKIEYDNKRYVNNREDIINNVKEYRLNNLASIKIHKQEYNNRSDVKERSKTYHKIYRETYKVRRNILERERLLIDPDYAMKKRLRNNLLSAVKKQPKCHNRKPASIFELLGCNLQEFKTYFESKFVNGMTWELFCNSDVIHIDHIIPCYNFDLSDIDQAKECFHYTNLQPLWKWENLSKGYKIIS